MATNKDCYFYGLCGTKAFGEDLKHCLSVTYRANLDKFHIMQVRTKSKTKVGVLLRQAIKQWVKDNKGGKK